MTTLHLRKRRRIVTAVILRRYNTACQHAIPPDAPFFVVQLTSDILTTPITTDRTIEPTTTHLRAQSELAPRSRQAALGRSKIPWVHRTRTGTAGMLAMGPEHRPVATRED